MDKTPQQLPKPIMKQNRWYAALLIHPSNTSRSTANTQRICYIELQREETYETEARNGSGPTESLHMKSPGTTMMAKPLEPILKRSSMIEMLMRLTLDAEALLHNESTVIGTVSTLTLTCAKLLNCPSSFLSHILKQYEDEDDLILEKFLGRLSGGDILDDSSREKEHAIPNEFNRLHCFQKDTWMSFFQLIASAGSSAVVETCYYVDDVPGGSCFRLLDGILNDGEKWIARRDLYSTAKNAQYQFMPCRLWQWYTIAILQSILEDIQYCQQTWDCYKRFDSKHIVGIKTPLFLGHVYEALELGTRIASYCFIVDWMSKNPNAFYDHLKRDLNTLKSFLISALEELQKCSYSQRAQDHLNSCEIPREPRYKVEFLSTVVQLQNLLTQVQRRLNQKPFLWNGRLAGKLLLLAFLLDSPSALLTIVTYIVAQCTSPFTECPELLWIFFDLPRKHQLYFLQLRLAKFYCVHELYILPNNFMNKMCCIKNKTTNVHQTFTSLSEAPSVNKLKYTNTPLATPEETYQASHSAATLSPRKLQRSSTIGIKLDGQNADCDTILSQGNVHMLRTQVPTNPLNNTDSESLVTDTKHPLLFKNEKPKTIVQERQMKHSLKNLDDSRRKRKSSSPRKLVSISNKEIHSSMQSPLRCVHSHTKDTCLTHRVPEISSPMDPTPLLNESSSRSACDTGSRVSRTVTRFPCCAPPDHQTTFRTPRTSVSTFPHCHKACSLYVKEELPACLTPQSSCHSKNIKMCSGCAARAYKMPQDLHFNGSPGSCICQLEQHNHSLCSQTRDALPPDSVNARKSNALTHAISPSRCLASSPTSMDLQHLPSACAKGHYRKTEVGVQSFSSLPDPQKSTQVVTYVDPCLYLDNPESFRTATEQLLEKYPLVENVSTTQVSGNSYYECSSNCKSSHNVVVDHASVEKPFSEKSRVHPREGRMGEPFIMKYIPERWSAEYMPQPPSIEYTEGCHARNGQLEHKGITNNVKTVNASKTHRFQCSKSLEEPLNPERMRPDSTNLSIYLSQKLVTLSDTQSSTECKSDIIPSRDSSPASVRRNQGPSHPNVRTKKMSKKTYSTPCSALGRPTNDVQGRLFVEKCRCGSSTHEQFSRKSVHTMFQPRVVDLPNDLHRAPHASEITDQPTTFLSTTHSCSDRYASRDSTARPRTYTSAEKHCVVVNRSLGSGQCQPKQSETEVHTTLLQSIKQSDEICHRSVQRQCPQKIIMRESSFPIYKSEALKQEDQFRCPTPREKKLGTIASCTIPYRVNFRERLAASQAKMQQAVERLQKRVSKCAQISVVDTLKAYVDPPQTLSSEVMQQDKSQKVIPKSSKASWKSQEISWESQDAFLKCQKACLPTHEIKSKTVDNPLKCHENGHKPSTKSVLVRSHLAQKSHIERMHRSSITIIQDNNAYTKKEHRKEHRKEHKIDRHVNVTRKNKLRSLSFNKEPRQTERGFTVQSFHPICYEGKNENNSNDLCVLKDEGLPVQLREESQPLDSVLKNIGLQVCMSLFNEVNSHVHYYSTQNMRLALDSTVHAPTSSNSSVSILTNDHTNEQRDDYNKDPNRIPQVLLNVPPVQLVVLNAVKDSFQSMSRNRQKENTVQSQVNKCIMSYSHFKPLALPANESTVCDGVPGHKQDEGVIPCIQEGNTLEEAINSEEMRKKTDRDEHCNGVTKEGIKRLPLKQLKTSIAAQNMKVTQWDLEHEGMYRGAKDSTIDDCTMPLTKRKLESSKGTHNKPPLKARVRSQPKMSTRVEKKASRTLNKSIDKMNAKKSVSIKNEASQYDNRMLNGEVKEDNEDLIENENRKKSICIENKPNENVSKNTKKHLRGRFWVPSMTKKQEEERIQAVKRKHQDILKEQRLTYIQQYLKQINILQERISCSKKCNLILVGAKSSSWDTPTTTNDNGVYKEGKESHNGDSTPATTSAMPCINSPYDSDKACSDEEAFDLYIEQNSVL